MNWATKHKGLIKQLASKAYWRATACGSNEELSDFIQDGYAIALVAQQKFDASRGFAESTYLHRALTLEFNNKIDRLLYRRSNEVQELEWDTGVAQEDSLLELWAFARNLSPAAQMILQHWISPSESLDREIRARTIGRRCSLRALILYLKERGQCEQTLDAILNEILVKAGANA